MVKGFYQKNVLDFDEIYSSIVKMSSIRVLLGLTSSLNLEVQQLNVKTTFFHGDLEEEIYMLQSEGFKVKGKEHMVCRLNVDDLLIIGQDVKIINKLKGELTKSFDMKDLSEARQILGKQIIRDIKSKQLWLSHEKIY